LDEGPERKNTASTIGLAAAGWNGERPNDLHHLSCRVFERNVSAKERRDKNRKRELLTD
jgi:hypothetical protein